MFLRVIGAIVLVGVAFGAGADNGVGVKLVSDSVVAVPGAVVRVGVLFDIPERSHIYWSNPGDSGLPTDVEWKAGKDIEVGELKWPAPREFRIEGLDNEAYFGYLNQVLLFSELYVPADAVADDVLNIGAGASWLLCLDDGACIPEDENLTISLAVRKTPRKSYEAVLFDKYAKSVPIKNDVSEIKWQTEPQIGLIYRFSEGSNLLDNYEGPVLRYFPNSGGAWKGEVTNHGREILLLPEYKDEKADGGVLVIPLVDASDKRSVKYVEVPAMTEK
jgi:hypothetical protein